VFCKGRINIEMMIGKKNEGLERARRR